ncbi:MAG: NAD(P)H-binding protein [Pseudomonadota bacterium]
MKLCIVGGTGNSGRALVRSALARGHDVTALVRNEAKIADLAHPRLCASVVSLGDHAALTRTLCGHDAVINAAGYVSEGPAFVDLVQGVIRAADAALGAGGRFWLFGGAALLDVPGAGVCTLDLPGVPKFYQAHRANFKAVGVTALDWSMLCPGPMIEAPGGKASEELVLSAEVWPTAPPYMRVLPRVALALAFKHAVPRMTIYYEDAARVILDNLQRGGPYSHKRVGIALANEETRSKTAPTR